MISLEHLNEASLRNLNSNELFKLLADDPDPHVQFIMKAMKEELGAGPGIVGEQKSELIAKSREIKNLYGMLDTERNSRAAAEEEADELAKSLELVNSKMRGVAAIMFKAPDSNSESVFDMLQPFSDQPA